MNKKKLRVVQTTIKEFYKHYGEKETIKKGMECYKEGSQQTPRQYTSGKNDTWHTS